MKDGYKNIFRHMSTSYAAQLAHQHGGELDVHAIRWWDDVKFLLGELGELGISDAQKALESMEQTETNLVRVGSFSARLLEARKEAGLDLSELARRAGISKGHLSNMEKTPDYNPGADVLVKLAKVLGVSVDWLVGMK